jgi:hypothetical protein
LDSITFVSIIIALGIIVAMIIVALGNIRKTNRVVLRGVNAVKSFRPDGHRYVQGQFSDQMELDMRLPYRRFRQLYPESKLNYEEYKKMQMRTAFRRSFSSQDNKRMVR